LVYVGRLERGEASPSIDLVANLAAGLNVPISELLPSDRVDPLPDLKREAERRFKAILDKADNSSLMMLNPWLALLDDTLNLRSRSR